MIYGSTLKLPAQAGTQGRSVSMTNNASTKTERGALVRLFAVTLVAVVLLVCAMSGCGNKQQDMDIQALYPLVDSVGSMGYSAADTAATNDFVADIVGDSVAVDSILALLYDTREKFSKVEAAWENLSAKYPGDNHLDSARGLNQQCLNNRRLIDYLARHVIGFHNNSHLIFVSKEADFMVDTWSDCIQKGTDFQFMMGSLAKLMEVCTVRHLNAEGRISHWLAKFSPKAGDASQIGDAHKHLGQFFIVLTQLRELSHNPEGNYRTFSSSIKDLKSRAKESYQHFKLTNAGVLESLI